MSAPIPPQVPGPQAPPAQPEQTQQPALPMQPPVAPWSPFQPRPNDSEPLIAQLWMKRLSNVISTVKFDAQPIEWRQCLVEKYEAARMVVAASQQPPPEEGPPPKGQPKPKQPQGAPA